MADCEVAKIEDLGVRIGVEAITARKAQSRNRAKTNAKLYEGAINKALDITEIAMRERVGETMRTWSKKAEVVLRRRIYAGYTVLQVDVKSRVWHWLNEGTPAHDISPRFKTRLRFLSGYKAKTRVGRLLSVNGGAFGKPVFARKVRHPGIKARKWSERIERETQQVLAQQIEKQLTIAAKEGF